MRLGPQTARDINGRLILWLGDTGKDEYATRYVLIGGEWLRVKTNRKTGPSGKKMMHCSYNDEKYQGSSN